MIGKTLEEFRKLKDVKVANKELYNEVAYICKVSPKQVEEVIKEGVGRFIANTMKRGAFETVMVPKFGKFKAKEKQVQWSKHSKVLPRIPKTDIKQTEQTDDSIPT